METIDYTGIAQTAYGTTVEISGTFDVVDEISTDREVGILSGCVVIDHPDFQDPLEIPEDELKAMYEDQAEQDAYDRWHDRDL